MAAPEMKHFYCRVRRCWVAGFGIADADFSLSIGEQLRSAKTRRLRATENSAIVKGGSTSSIVSFSWLICFWQWEE